MTAPTMTDAEARDVIRTRLDTSVVVEAAAGTGKTTELVTRILGILTTGRAEMRDIVAVTFTEKAAGELRLRLRQRLEETRRKAAGEEALRIERAVQSLEEAHVSTIHGFCADLLRMRPVEARVDPLFTVLTEGQSTRLLSEVFEAWLRQRLEDPPEGVRRSLRRPVQAWGADAGPIGRLRQAVADVNQWRDHRAPWTREPFDRHATMVALVDLVHALADVTERPSSTKDTLHLDTAPVRDLSRTLRRAAELGEPEDEDGLEARLVELSRNRDWLKARKGTGASFAPGVPRAQVQAARDGLMAALETFRQQADADLAAALHDELGDCLEAYELRKQAEGALDFLDLLVRARDLVRDDGEARRHFQRRFSHIFVDEFQDTDPLQAELLLLLAADDPAQRDWQAATPTPGKLFVVGDPKQAIYRFRRADVAVYRQVCGQLVRAGALAVALRKSFRSRPSMQRFVNAAFARVMDGSPVREQASYVPLEAERPEDEGQPTVVALPVPRPYGPRSLSAKAIEASLPDAVGAFVHWLVHDSGWKVTDPRGGTELVPVAPRHVCILFRRFTSYGEDVTRPYVDALEARGLPHVLVGGRSLRGRDEVEALRAGLTAIEWPDDALAVYATLRGSLFAIGDEELLEYHHLGGRFHPFAAQVEGPGRLAPIREALDLLAGLHRRRNRQPVAETVTALLSATRAHVGFALRPNGEQVLANALHVVEHARRYELEGGLSFRGFVDALSAESGESRGAEAPILEEASDGVRVMTVHKAKGLEFPVIILADITARLTPFEPSRAVDGSRGLCAVRLAGCAPLDLLTRQAAESAFEQAEAERVAYVAATRARDLLVVSAVGDAPWEGGWTGPLHSALYPPEDRRRTPAREVPGCPAFASRDTVLARPDGDPARAATVCPGGYTMNSDDGDYPVVWWSPEQAVLSLDATVPLGLRREDLVVKDVAPDILRTYVERFEDWQRQRDRTLTEGARPAFVVRQATEAARQDDVASATGEVQVDRVEIDTGPHPSGARYGTLVHLVLADVPLGKELEHEQLRRLVALHASALGATEEEAAAATRTAAQVLTHPVLAAAARAAADGRCWREVSVSHQLPSGLLIEGTIDLAFVDGDTIVVVDYKTDRDVDGSWPVYRAQVALYAAAVASASGTAVRGVIVTL